MADLLLTIVISLLLFPIIVLLWYGIIMFLIWQYTDWKESKKQRKEE